MIIPEGYKMVPEDLYNKFIQNLVWLDIVEPTINDLENYLGISSSKIRQDLNKIDCPLRETYEGGKGKGNQKRFVKSTVELYKSWLIKR